MNPAPVRIAALAAGLLVGAALPSASGAVDPTFRVAAPSFPSNTVSLADHGGVGDGRTLNTAAFEKAFAALSEQGGGTLVVPRGFWLTGPIRFRSRINLHLERGALVRFSDDPSLYPLKVTDIKGEKQVDSTSPLSGEDLDDIAITGQGILDGGGDAWRPVKKGKLNEREWKALVGSGGVLDAKGGVWWPSQSAMDGAKAVGELRRQGCLDLAAYEPYHRFLRPRMLRFIGCRRVLIEGVTFRNPPAWTMNPTLCEDVSVLGVHVSNAAWAQNSDALDLESCRRAVIRDCVFDTGDDGICLKSGKDAAGRRIGIPTEEVLVEGCTDFHAHGGFVSGSEMSGGVRNVRVSNCTFLGTDIGLRFKSARGRGGVVEKILVEDLRMEDITAAAVDFNMYYGDKGAGEEPGEAAAPVRPDEGTPHFRDIRVRNLVCRGAGTAVVLRGLPENPIRDITLENVSFTSRNGISVKDADRVVFENVRMDNSEGEPVTASGVEHSVLSLVQ